MKIKISYLVITMNKSLFPTDDNYIKTLLTNEGFLPSAYMGTGDESSTLRSIHEKYLNVDYEWTTKMLCGFRKLNQSEAEIIYITTLSLSGVIEKKGDFYTFDKMEKSHLPELDPYYVELISKFGSSTFRR